MSKMTFYLIIRNKYMLPTRFSANFVMDAKELSKSSLLYHSLRKKCLAQMIKELNYPNIRSQCMECRK